TTDSSGNGITIHGDDTLGLHTTRSQRSSMGPDDDISERKVHQGRSKFATIGQSPTKGLSRALSSATVVESALQKAPATPRVQTLKRSSGSSGAINSS
ncbi:hypothetical protein SARC_14713, partial [Sphaeroforma arctica JP610]